MLLLPLIYFHSVSAISYIKSIDMKIKTDRKSVIKKTDCSVIELPNNQQIALVGQSNRLYPVIHFWDEQ